MGLRFCKASFCQKNPRVRKVFARNSGAGNGCANFMGVWKNAFFLQENPMPIKFLVLGGVFGFFFVGGGSADLIFMGARIFLILKFCRLTRDVHSKPWCHIQVPSSSFRCFFLGITGK